MGARVTLVDMFGPGNSRSTSGDETRGVRTSYGDRPHGELWMQWANVAIDRWKQWDAEYSKPLRMRLFFTTGDIILRSDWEPFLVQTRAWWQKNGIPHETLTLDEVRKPWPQIDTKHITAVAVRTQRRRRAHRHSTVPVAQVFHRRAAA